MLQDQIAELRTTYPKGTKIKLIKMEDPQAPPPGTIGTVKGVDDAGQILMSWETGSSLSLIPNVDDFEIV